MTFEKVIADVGSSFAAGQVYVALSRCTSLNGLILKSQISRNSIKTDNRVLHFAENELPETLLIEEMQQGKADYLYAESRKSFMKGDTEECITNFTKALKYRNDIETDTFKRYISLLINKFHRNISQISTLTKRNKEISDRICEIEGRCAELVENNKKLSENLDDVQSELDENKRKLEDLIDEKEEIQSSIGTDKKEW